MTDALFYAPAPSVKSQRNLLPFDTTWSRRQLQQITYLKQIAGAPFHRARDCCTFESILQVYV
jgi:hypothetical protein